MPNLNYSTPNTPIAHPKRKLLIAILLGMLTFIVTPLIATVIAIPFFFLDSDNFNPVVIIASIFGLRELGGFFLAQFVLIATLALLSDFATAIISWFINRTKRLAVITFVSALAFQVVSVAIVLPATIKKSQETIQSGIEHEQSYQQYAKIGDVSYEFYPLPSNLPVLNTFPEYGPLGDKLEIIVPVTVSQEGTYLVTAQYNVSKGKINANTTTKNVTKYLKLGDNIMRLEFLANELNTTFWSPQYVGGTVQAQLFYLESERELLENIDSDPAIDQKIFEQFLKDEGLDKREAGTKPSINQFIEKKNVQF